ncbi:4'-phosphopantetheinyl transferase superfamily protein [Nibrella saemangeumensis]|uniref:4'-phosphopantetheinyl transferase superfamily protein n=1 Tax=Nibrella saemangeumensis TaxID=1084526 RepID=A0ABP8MFR4_9BACT
MPQYTAFPFNSECTALLWKIEEDEESLRIGLPLTEPEWADLGGITHPAQRVEWMACRAAMRLLAESQGLTYAGLYKDEFGKPHLIAPADFNAGHISLTHTAGWAAVVWHASRPVGIDIEPIREQFVRVVPRVLSEVETAHAGQDLMRLAVYWCAKEALYKLYGKRQLTFREHLIIEPFADGATQLNGHVRLPDHEEKLTICCRTTGPGLLAVAF